MRRTHPRNGRQVETRPRTFVDAWPPFSALKHAMLLPPVSQFYNYLVCRLCWLELGFYCCAAKLMFHRWVLICRSAGAPLTYLRHAITCFQPYSRTSRLWAEIPAESLDSGCDSADVGRTVPQFVGVCVFVRATCTFTRNKMLTRAVLMVLCSHNKHYLNNKNNNGKTI